LSNQETVGGDLEVTGAIAEGSVISATLTVTESLWVGTTDVGTTLTTLNTYSLSNHTASDLAAGATGSDLSLSRKLSTTANLSDGLVANPISVNIYGDMIVSGLVELKNTSTAKNLTVTDLAAKYLVVTDNIKLPTTLTTPASGYLGYIISGSFSTNLVSRTSPCSGYISSISLPIGVWLLQATAGVFCSTGGNNLNNFAIQVSNSENLGATLTARNAVALTLTSPYSSISYNSINANYWNTIDTTAVVTMTTTSTYYLNYFPNFSGGTKAYNVSNTTNNPCSFKAIRIA